MKLLKFLLMLSFVSFYLVSMDKEDVYRTDSHNNVNKLWDLGVHWPANRPARKGVNPATQARIDPVTGLPGENNFLSDVKKREIKRLLSQIIPQR